MNQSTHHSEIKFSLASVIYSTFFLQAHSIGYVGQSSAFILQGYHQASPTLAPGPQLPLQQNVELKIQCPMRAGVKQSVYMSVVVRTKITRSRVLGSAVSTTNRQISAKNWFPCAINGLLVLQIVHFLFNKPVVYRPHPVCWHVVLQLRIIRSLLEQTVLQYYGTLHWLHSARGMCSRELQFLEATERLMTKIPIVRFTRCYLSNANIQATTGRRWLPQ